MNEIKGLSQKYSLHIYYVEYIFEKCNSIEITEMFFKWIDSFGHSERFKVLDILFANYMTNEKN